MDCNHNCPGDRDPDHTEHDQGQKIREMQLRLQCLQRNMRALCDTVKEKEGRAWQRKSLIFS